MESIEHPNNNFYEELWFARLWFDVGMIWNEIQFNKLKWFDLVESPYNYILCLFSPNIFSGENFFFLYKKTFDFTKTVFSIKNIFQLKIHSQMEYCKMHVLTQCPNTTDFVAWIEFTLFPTTICLRGLGIFCEEEELSKFEIFRTKFIILREKML